MKVIFNSRQLQKRFESSKEAVREWGPIVGRNYIKRITAILAADTFDHLPRIPTLGFHALNSNRAGQFAVSLAGKVRLIFTRRVEEGNEVAVIHEVDLDHYGI